VNFPDSFSKISQIPKFIKKICPVGGELFHADGRPGVMKLKVAFRNFANAPEKQRKVTSLLENVDVTIKSDSEMGTAQSDAITV
jgi:hypothetical protein